jgi:2-polyprenyl-3-methyl-5-hydroxy-6-metoxy-1,4-benzoquinol methylase
MRLKIETESILEQIAIMFNLVPKPLIDTQVAFNSARSIIAAADLGLFEALEKSSKTFEELALNISSHPAATKSLLDCLVGVGYINWKNGKYSLRPKYYKWLLKEYPTNIIGKLKFQISEWNWMGHLEEYVQSGRSIDIHSTMSKDEWSLYQEGMRSLAINTSKELAEKMQLPANATKMLDIGGAHGLYSLELCKKNPLLMSIVLELPGAIEKGSEIAAQHNLYNRLNYKVGNVLTEDLGEKEYDVIMINNLVHHFTVEENYSLAKKIARALKPGGIFCIGELIRLQKPGEGGVAAATAGLYFALTSSSGTWSLEEIKSWQKNAGLKPYKTFGLMTLPGWKMSIAYK